MKNARQEEIVKIIQSMEIETQDQLLEVLRSRGFSTTQATISRDIKDLRMVKELTGSGGYRYAMSDRKSSAASDTRLRNIFKETAHPYTKGLFGSLPSLDKKTHRLKPIAGLMPDPANLPEGCKFHPRCPYADETCRTQEPMTTELSPGHLVRCHRCTKHAQEEGENANG